MSTIIGFNGYDPKLKKEYVLLGSDSQGSSEDGSEKDFFFSKMRAYSKNFIYCTAGSFFTPKDLEGKALTAHQNLIDSNKLSFKKIKRNLKEISNQFENDFIFGMLNKNNYSLGYIISGESDKDISFVSAGSGGEFAYDFMLDHLNNLKKSENKTLILSAKEAMNLVHGCLKKSELGDEYTGGNPEFGLLINGEIRNYFFEDRLNSPNERNFKELCLEELEDKKVRKIISPIDYKILK